MKKSYLISFYGQTDLIKTVEIFATNKKIASCLGYMCRPNKFKSMKVLRYNL